MTRTFNEVYPDPMDLNKRRCIKCGEVKHTKRDFGKDTKGYPRSRCHECMRAYNKKYNDLRTLENKMNKFYNQTGF